MSRLPRPLFPNNNMGFFSAETSQLTFKCFCHLRKATYMPKVSRFQIYPILKCSNVVDYMGLKGVE